MTTSAISIEPLTPTIGATVHGVDLTQPIDEETFQFIYDAWMEHLVLFFRDQPMSPDQHLTFGRMFGELHIHPAAPFEHGNPELMRIHTDKDSFRNNGERWHSDVSADEEPPMASILHIHSIPSQGRRYMLVEHVRRLGRPVSTVADFARAADGVTCLGLLGSVRRPQAATRIAARGSPDRAGPIPSPVARRCSSTPASPSASTACRLMRATLSLASLFEHVKNVNFQCRFKWDAHSVALWDNRCTQHMAIWDYYPESRSGIRVTVKGDKPF